MIPGVAFVARWWKPALIVAVIAFGAWQQVRISGLQAEIAKERQFDAQREAMRSEMARLHATQTARLQAQHAQTQQEQENAYEQKLAALETRRRADGDELGRLRNDLAAYTARGRRNGETDAAALKRAEDRLEVVGALLDESLRLLVEGKGVVEGRDAEVGRLLEQIRLDRQTCQARAAERAHPAS